MEFYGAPDSMKYARKTHKDTDNFLCHGSMYGP
jgi:hypothetical protein